MGIVRATRAFLRRAALRRFYGELIRGGDLCFDIGANRGDRTEILLGLGARVVAVEPQGSCVEALHQRFSGSERLTVVARAVADRAGEATLMVCNESQLSTLSQEFIDAYAQPRFSWDQRQPVEVTTLDDLVAEHGEPAYVKVDVEGLEPQVFGGLSRTVPLISFEYNARLAHLACRAVEALERIAPAEYNFVAFERPRFELAAWVDSSHMTGFIEQMPESILTGEVFVRFPRP